jgi:hypothetical protein
MTSIIHQVIRESLDDYLPKSLVVLVQQYDAFHLGFRQNYTLWHGFESPSMYAEGDALWIKHKEFWIDVFSGQRRPIFPQRFHNGWLNVPITKQDWAETELKRSLETPAFTLLWDFTDAHQVCDVTETLTVTMKLQDQNAFVLKQWRKHQYLCDGKFLYSCHTRHVRIVEQHPLSAGQKKSIVLPVTISAKSWSITNGFLVVVADGQVWIHDCWRERSAVLEEPHESVHLGELDIVTTWNKFALPPLSHPVSKRVHGEASVTTSVGSSECHIMSGGDVYTLYFCR